MRSAILATLVSVAAAAPAIVWETDYAVAYVTEDVTVTATSPAAYPTPAAGTGGKKWWHGGHKHWSHKPWGPKNGTSAPPAYTTPSTAAAATTTAPTTPAATTPAYTTPETTPAVTTPYQAPTTTPEETTPAATTPEVTTPAATTPETTPAATTPAASSTYQQLPSATLGGGYKYTYPSGNPLTKTHYTPDKGTFIQTAHATVYTYGPTDSPTTTSVQESACTAQPGDYQADAIAIHNQYRDIHQANPVIWDDDLACAAQRQAEVCSFKHMTYMCGGGYGQNIYATTGDSNNVTGVVASWYAEVKNYGSYTGTDPTSATGDVGHFTQVVWASTVAIGCATVKCPSLQFDGGSPWGESSQTVCNYFIPGNWAGQYADNVKKPVSSP